MLYVHLHPYTACTPSFWRTQTNVSSSSYTLSFLSSSLWLKHTDTQQHKNKNNFKTRGDDSFPTERVFAKDELAPDGLHVAIHQHKREPQEQSDAAEPGRTSRTDNSDSDSHILHTTCAQLDFKKTKQSLAACAFLACITTKDVRLLFERELGRRAAAKAPTTRHGRAPTVVQPVMTSLKLTYLPLRCAHVKTGGQELHYPLLHAWKSFVSIFVSCAKRDGIALATIEEPHAIFSVCHCRWPFERVKCWQRALMQQRNHHQLGMHHSQLRAVYGPLCCMHGLMPINQ